MYAAWQDLRAPLHDQHRLQPARCRLRLLVQLQRCTRLRPLIVRQWSPLGGTVRGRTQPWRISAQSRADWCDGTYTMVAEGWAMAFVYVDAFGRPLPAQGAAPVAVAVPAAPRALLPPEAIAK